MNCNKQIIPTFDQVGYYGTSILFYISTSVLIATVILNSMHDRTHTS